MNFQRWTQALTLGAAAGLLAQPVHARTLDQHDRAVDATRLRMNIELLPEDRQGGAVEQADNEAPAEQEGLSLRLAAAVTATRPSMSSGGSGAQQPVAHLPVPQALLEKYYKGAYREVSAEGLLLLNEEPRNNELRFIVANSLAWSGQARDALPQYEALSDTNYHDRALLGLGNVNRWNGRPDRAAAAYRDVLRKEPGNEEALEGLRLANRELRPRTGVGFGRAANSNDTSRTWASLSHAWRNESGTKGYELTAGRVEEDRNGLRILQRDLTLRHEDLDAMLSELEVTVQEAPRTRLFGKLTLKAPDQPAQLHVGRVNWGKLAYDPAALRDGLTANRIGGDGRFSNMLGDFRLAYNAYRVSDGNLVQDANFHFTPALQPFPVRNVRSFVGAEARKARFEDRRYWSPRDGHYNALVGINADWSNTLWQTYGSIQYGLPLTSNSGRSWSTGFGVKRWLGKDWAAGAQFWAIHTPRDGGYRSHSGSVRIERLW
jgi:tetratricopeptide (TPR) repeat protein